MRKNLSDVLQERILILDGGMGTTIQQLNLQEDDFRGVLFARHHVPLKGDYDVLNISDPEVVKQIHRSYIEAGADLITTNTFSSNAFSQKEYGLEHYVKALNFQGASLAREVADEFEDRTVWVVGTMGPTAQTLSFLPDVNGRECRESDSCLPDREETFNLLVSTYKFQAECLVKGGADVLMLETCFDVLNAEAALYAIGLLNEEWQVTIPVMVSATINNKNGRMLTGQTLEDFYASISRYSILSFGINCSYGVTELEPFIEQLSQTLPCYISLHPNAGLPDEKGKYEQSPEFMAAHMKAIARKGLLNIAGGCCGTTPDYIRLLARELDGVSPRRLPR